MIANIQTKVAFVTISYNCKKQDPQTEPQNFVKIYHKSFGTLVFCIDVNLQKIKIVSRFFYFGLKNENLKFFKVPSVQKSGTKRNWQSCYAFVRKKSVIQKSGPTNHVFLLCGYYFPMMSYNGIFGCFVFLGMPFVKKIEIFGRFFWADRAFTQFSPKMTTF